MERLGLLDKHPQQLAGEHDAAEVFQAFATLERMNGAQEASLRYAIAFWVMQALSRSGDTQTLSLLDKLCIAASRRAVQGANGEFAIRLGTFREVLEHKRQAIAGGQSRRADRLLRAQSILDALAEGPLTQAALGSRLGLTPGRVSQLLSVMEEAQLVRRERRGRESVVTRVEVPDAVSVRQARWRADTRPALRPLCAFEAVG